MVLLRLLDHLFSVGFDLLIGPIRFEKPGHRLAAIVKIAKCMDFLRDGEDALVVWKSDRLGRSTIELLKIVDNLRIRNIGFKSLTEDLLDTTSPNGRLVFGIFALLAEHERDRIRERTKAGLKAARARGRNGWK